MTPPLLVGRHYRSGQPVQILTGHGRILQVLPLAGGSPSELPWIAPALIDLQVNGFAGVDLQSSDPLDLSQLGKMVEGLERSGCTRFLPTLITAPWPDLLDRLRHLRRARARDERLGRAMAGWHVEGPFLSAVPGYVGAHDPACMIDPSPDRLDDLQAAVCGDALLVTLAPERPGAIESIQHASSRGLRVNLGHTNAGGDRLEQACRAGATGFTHLGNACPQVLDRHDNLLWRVLDLVGSAEPASGTHGPRLHVSVIPDGIHVSPPLFRLFHRLLGASNLYYVSDAMAAAGAPPGTYSLGSLTLEVGPDHVVRLPGRPNFAGSALTPLDGVFRAADMLRLPWQACWDAFSVRAAERMGWTWGLEAGAPADCCLLDWPAAPRQVGPPPAARLSGLRLRVLRAGEQVQETLLDSGDRELGQAVSSL